LLRRVLSGVGYRVETAADGQEALEKVGTFQPDALLLDLKMPVMDGLETLRRLGENNGRPPTVVLTAHSTVETAVQAMKLGAFDYLTKPFDVEEIKVVVQKALQVNDLQEEVRGLRREVQGQYGLERVIGKDPRMLHICEMIQRIAQSRSSVLIEGESGTGKELIARAIHYLSPRAKRPFVKVNCAALSETLLESELFGHEKGAFTGAERSRQGRFQAAEGGSILLDEISEMSPKLQAKLLRVLQEREINRVGGDETIAIDVRVLATTNRRLEEEIEAGRFREDLFFRLNVVRIAFPPLRERPGDIPLLASHFVEKYNHEMGRRFTGISASALEALQSYAWPGNVRELQNAIERAIVLGEEPEIQREALPRSVQGDSRASIAGGMPVGITLAEAEKRLIQETLRLHEGNRTRTAETLDISIRTLRNKLKEYQEQDLALSV
ncbi:MAG TPA: sigma-54-dependent Fis family transcriptional regulator, partial [Firmicutes bacterium]|nr:sigma-54-dependent Fis family transcriptional regulator [Bacillota bacterium]